MVVRTNPNGYDSNEDCQVKAWNWMAMAVVFGLSGCVTPSAGQLRDHASSLYQARTVAPAPSGAKPEATNGGLVDLLSRPVDADAAVRIALLNSPRVTSIYTRIGFARADLYDAARLSNPTLGYVSVAGGTQGRKSDWSLAQNFTELLFLRSRRADSESRVLRAEQQVARELLGVEADVRAAQWRFVGSRTVSEMRDRIARSNEISATYAQQLFDAGNISRLQLARMREAADLAKSDALRARANETADRNALLTLLGIGSDQHIDLVGEYAMPSANMPVVKDVQSWALENRLDLLSAREALRFASVARTRARRWRGFGDSSIGVAVEKEGVNGSASSETRVGPSASLAIPIFNQGAGTAGRAQSTVDELAAEVRSIELSIGNDVATRIAALDAARESIALYREKLVPEQRTIVEESQKQQNYMLIGTFELLSAKQHQYEGYEAYIGALRDYWVAYVELLQATGGRYPGLEGTKGAPRVEPFTEIESAPGEHP